MIISRLAVIVFDKDDDCERDSYLLISLLSLTNTEYRMRNKSKQQSDNSGLSIIIIGWHLIL